MRRDTLGAECGIMGVVWFTVLGIVFVCLLLLLGAAMLARFVLRRRLRAAESRLPVSALSGTALLVGTNFDANLRGLGALALTTDMLVFEGAAVGRSLHIPRGELRAAAHRRARSQRKPSLRVQWGPNVAQFEVDQPSVDDWVAALGG